MSRIYVFDWDNTDFSTVGECGSLMPTSCLFEEIANGMSEITLKHPLDPLGKYTFLQRDSVLKVEVPVRTTPEIESGAFVTQVEEWTVKQTATKPERSVYSKQEGGKKKKTLKLGAKVIVTKKPEDSDRWKIKTGKISGWIASSGLEQSVEIILPDTATGIEDAAPAWECRDQLFRIYDISRMNDEITCNARHISYDLLRNLSTYDTSKSVTLQETLNGIMDSCMDPHEFTAQTDISASRTGAHYIDVDPISAILDPDTGLAEEYSAQMVRDDYEIFLLQNAGADRGTRISYGKNMTGITFNENMDDVATAIRPIGEKKNGEELYLEGDGLVVSPIANQYPFKRIYPLTCTDCKVGTDGVTTAIARKRMQEQAQDIFDSGGDLPTISVSVTFSQLGDSERYKEFKRLENVFLFDEVTVVHPKLGVNVTTEVIRVIWDCLREKMNTVELGSLKEMVSSVASWQISSGVSGSKIANGTIGSAQLGGDIISARHMQADSINTDALQAGSVTAQKIQGGTVEALSLEAVTAKIENLTASDIATDRLAAAVAAFTVVTAGTASFDQATIKHLMAQAMNLEYGVGGDVFIRNLRVLYGQMLQATIGDLCIKASDGNYYNIDVDENGNVTAAKNTAITDGEINAGQTEEGRVILETHITAESLNTGSLLATYALVNKIDTARIDVGELFANTAFIGALTTNTIVGDKSITIMAQDIAANEAAIAAQNASLANAVTDLNKSIDDLQSQVDGGITTWYLEGEPTASNEPAVNWTTEELREEHQGDLYYDKLTGYSYRWMLDGTAWLWKRVADTDVSEALKLASSAKDTADAKKRIFFTQQPTPPYDAGDLWVQGSGGDIYVCKIPKLAGFAFAQSDWQLASKYTDDTKANAAKSAADAAQAAANSAQTAADAAQAEADAASAAADTAGEVAQNAVEAIGDIPQRMEVKIDGTYFKDEKNASVLKINSGSVTIGTLVGEGKGYSQFAANYVQFGNYQLRRTADGGLAFKLMEG